MKRILVLFPNDWDRGELGRSKYKDQFEFVFEGPDFFKFPGTLALPAFRPVKMTEALAVKYAGKPVDGVMSSDEYVGAAMAAALAKRLGLPCANASDILTAQHKYYARLRQEKATPEAVPRFGIIPLARPLEVPDLPFPFFVKPVKGTFSLFAAKVDDEAALRRHLAFRLHERLLYRCVTAPFNQLLREYTDLELDANAFIAEELIEGVQVTLDGFAFDGDVQIMGVVDSVMFPGTSTFERFDYPSRLLAPEVRARMADIATRLVRGLGIRQAQFNIEMFFDARRDKIHIIEINPRLSYQFADLYENVDGTNSYDVLIDLTLGRRPTFLRGSGAYAYASSFVLRTFKGRRFVAVPSDRDIEAFSRQYDDARLRIYGRKGKSLASEMRAMGSYRHGIINVGAKSLLDLFAIYNDALEKLPFEFA
jgi:ATP-grasp domain-containing protein